jgi:hypothetical protein
MQRDAALGVPARPMQHDVIGLRLARTAPAKSRNAVVVAARLGAKHGDAESVRPAPSFSSSSTLRMPAMPFPGDDQSHVAH